MMHPRQIENIATQHTQELRAQCLRASNRRAARSDARRIRAQAGWTLVAVGLRLATSASR